jgi:hypothetical protein
VVEVFADRDNGVLARVVRGPGPGQEPGDRRGVDDVAAAVLGEERQERAAPVNDAPEVDAHHPLPCREWAEPGVSQTGNAGVVADDVDCPEPLDRGFGEGLYGLGPADVGLDAQRLHAP